MSDPAGASTSRLPRLLVGLGNPGGDYHDTRHNLGFRIAGEVARRRGMAIDRLECNARVAESRELTIALPLTYMNRSGHAVRCLVERRELEPADVLVVYDEVWLPLGRLRARSRGRAGGHRGMESVIASLRSEAIPRLRVGVGWEGGPPERVDLVEYVLEPFPADQRKTVDEIIERAADACDLWLRRGVQATMERFNG